MKNDVSTKTSLSERDEDTCVAIFRDVMRARHLLYRKAAKVADDIDLHAAEMNVIDILGKFGPIPMGRLSSLAFISPANTTSTVKKLEQAKLVARMRSENSDREVNVMLTGSGRTVFRKCYPRILGDVNEHLNQCLSKAERKIFAGLLQKFVI